MSGTLQGNSELVMHFSKSWFYITLLETEHTIKHDSIIILHIHKFFSNHYDVSLNIWFLIIDHVIH